MGRPDRRQPPILDLLPQRAQLPSPHTVRSSASQLPSAFILFLFIFDSFLNKIDGFQRVAQICSYPLGSAHACFDLPDGGPKVVIAGRVLCSQWQKLYCEPLPWSPKNRRGPHGSHHDNAMYIYIHLQNLQELTCRVTGLEAVAVSLSSWHVNLSWFGRLLPFLHRLTISPMTCPAHMKL